MPEPEDARAQVDSYKDEEYTQKQVQRLWATLSPALIALGQDLVGARKAGEPYDYQKHQERLRKALDQLVRLPPAERRRLFAALVPSIVNEVEAAWHVFERLPYSSGYNRRPFRFAGSGRPPEADAARQAWILNLLNAVSGFDQPVTWFAAWAPYLLGYYAPDALGLLFAGAIEREDAAGQEVFEILLASGRGEHPSGRMGRHVVRGLLCAARPEGWDFIGRMLLAAQREEGLRQVIIEAADEAHPQAFRRILGLVLEHNLARFSAIVRAAGVWTGLPFESASPRQVQEVLGQLQHLLAHPAAVEALLAAGSPAERYLALWATAYADVLQAIGACRPLLEDPLAEPRFAAVYFLSQVGLAESGQALLPRLSDPDLRVAACAFNGLRAHNLESEWLKDSDLFERLEELLPRLPAGRQALKPLVWEWLAIQADRTAAANALLPALGRRPVERLLPYLKLMDSYNRLAAARLLHERIDENPRCRQALLELAGDRDSYLHEHIFALLEGITPRAEEIPALEALLTRKTSGVRRGVIQLLLRQEDAGLRETIERLLARRDEPRQAGVELLCEMARAGREPAACRARAARLEVAGLSETEKHILAGLLAQETRTWSLEDALGLANPANLSPGAEPRSQSTLFGLRKKVRLGSPAAAAIIRALDGLVEQHRSEPVETSRYGQTEARTELLGNAHWGLVAPDPQLSAEENRSRFSLTPVWEQWWQERPKSMRDEDGCELLRARAALSLLRGRWEGMNHWTHEVPKELRTYLDEPYEFKPDYAAAVTWAVEWLAYLHPAPAETDFLLAAVEEVCFRFGRQPAKATNPYDPKAPWTIDPGRMGYLELARRQRLLHPAAWMDAQHARLWGLAAWLDRFTRQNGGTCRPMLEDVLLGLQAGAASRDDLLCYLLGERNEAQFGTYRFYELKTYSGRRPQPLATRFPALQQAVEQIRERILAVELGRGDLPTAASAPALSLRSVPGMQAVVRLLSALGKADFSRGWAGRSLDRSGVLSHLVRASCPLETDTPAEFAALVRAARIPARRLVELAVYAPQWARFVEPTLGWQGLEEGVWWVYAHNKDRQWAVDTEMRESWAAQVNEFTPLASDALMDGAVDVVWFQRMYAVLGQEHWLEIHQAALFASSGTGHARARLFADAMLGRAGADELLERVRAKRSQDAVRALGLVPLPEDAARPGEILRRYQAVQEFLRTSKQFGSQRQASEKLAGGIALENLARTAGYADPQRLEWAMELAAVADLAGGPLTVEVEGVGLTLAIDALGEAHLAARRGEKPLKAIPPALKKNEQAAALVERRQALERQARRMRASLEAAMVRGDEFMAGELRALFGHPILRVMLEQLVWVGPAGSGWLAEGGRALAGLGEVFPLNEADRLRIAHPLDLLEGGRWPAWQHECFVAERIQPFKQVFRELYLPAAAEEDEKNFSRRYAGQQVNPRQALALFGSRGWVSAPEEGVFKTFHAQGLTARAAFLQAAFTPAEVEGLTLEGVGFTRRGEWLALPLAQIPPRLFSEVMRDLDLVVSAAHAGGVDPEASTSTVEARAALVQQTCALLKLANVRVQERHALVNGKLGNYTIHLASATVHKQPGGAVCIIPVHAQQRGRLFLPFVDDDPKTAEVISKVILLAKDGEIKDPTILEQLL